MNISILGAAEHAVLAAWPILASMISTNFTFHATHGSVETDATWDSELLKHSSERVSSTRCLMGTVAAVVVVGGALVMRCVCGGGGVGR